MHWHLFPFQACQKRMSRFGKIPWFLLSLIVLILVNGTIAPLLHAQTETAETSHPVKILNYKSDIVLRQDASLKVTETIEVKTTGEEIEKGFYRNFPVNAPFMMGPMQFQVLQVLRDDKPIDYVVKDQGTNKHLQIELEGIELAADNYTYTIEYQIDRQLDFSDPDVDRLYWDVTGQDWHFPIEQVEAQVWLPGAIGKQNVQLNAFVGKPEDRSNRYEVKMDAEGNPTFVNTEPLQPRESLTIIVEFPSGYLERPTFTETLAYVFQNALRELLETFVSLGALLVIIVFLVFILIGIFSNANFPLLSQNRDRNN